MFDLEPQISQWRRQMIGAGIQSPEPLGEMENHLREEIRHRRAAGQSEEEAFGAAVSAIGDPVILAADFGGAKPRFPIPLTAGAVVWVGAAMALLGFLLSRWFDGQWSLLLTAHIFALTVGYATALMAGGLGIVEIWSRRAGRLVIRADQLTSALRHMMQAAAAMVVLGLILGLVWNAENHGRLWNGAPQELGTIIAALWLVAAAVVQRFTWFSLRHAVLLSVTGNVIIGFAWVGAGLLARGQGIGSVWQFDVLVGLHLFFLGLGRFSIPKAPTAC